MALYHQIWAKFLIQTVWYNVCSSAKRSLNVRTERPKTVKWPVACKRSISTIWVCLPIEYVLPLITVATNHSRCSNQSPRISSASSGGFAPKALQGLESKPLRLLAWQVALANEMFLFMDSMLILLTLPCTAVRTHTRKWEKPIELHTHCLTCAIGEYLGHLESLDDENVSIRLQVCLTIL